MSTEMFSRERAAGYIPEKLWKGCVLLAGAGSLAQAVIQNLALSGLAEMRIFDFDTHHKVNSSRAVLYPTPEEIEKWGTAKARSVASKAHALMTAESPGEIIRAIRTMEQ